MEFEKQKYEKMKFEIETKEETFTVHFSGGTIKEGFDYCHKMYPEALNITLWDIE